MSYIEVDLNYALIDAMLTTRGGIVDLFIEHFTRLVEIRARITVPRRSFELADAHSTEPVGARSWEVVANKPYALAVHNGVKARVILPRRGKVLRWRDEETGEVRFAAKVKQKARPGDPWLRRALIAEIDRL